MIPHTTPAAFSRAPAPSRFASLVRASPEGCAVALLGLPDDTGVRLNNGRPGAAEGPRAFRAALASYGVAEPHRWDWPTVFDAGDVLPAEGGTEAALHETHRRVTEATQGLLDLGLLPVAVGGGHDLTFPFVRAVAERAAPERLAGVYFDAHLDVRETVGSGMPFRRLVEACGVRELHIHGFQPFANAREHTAWFLANGGRIRGDITHPPPQAEARERRPPAGDPHAPFPEGDLFASFDLDVLDAAHAPGVSALNPAGWTVERGAAWAAACGRHPRVRCFDLMELSPPHDEQGRTARAAAHLFLSFLHGFAQRPGA